MNNDNDLIAEFIAESKEHLAHVESDVLKIEQQGENVDLEVVNHLFRAVHTVKGSSSFLDMEKITELSHSLENMISLVRSGELILDRVKAEAFLQGVDKLNILIDAIGNDGGIDIVKELEDLEAALSDSGKSGDEEGFEKLPDFSTIFDLSSNNAKLADCKKPIYAFTIDLFAECTAKKVLPLAILEEITLLGDIIASDLDLEYIGGLSEVKDKILFSFLIASVIDDMDILIQGMQIVPLRAEQIIIDSRGTQVGKKETTGADNQKPPGKKRKTGAKNSRTDDNDITTTDLKPVAESTVRIAVPLLDKLMNLASELVLVRNQHVQALNSNNIEHLANIAQRLNVVTSELQASIMQTRMRPIGNVFAKFARVVRDLANKLGKNVRLNIVGGEVELDKSIVEAIGDPLTHLVRNAVDHGIEFPDKRDADGKSPEGQLLLKAFHQAGQVHVQVSDDGKGLDPDMLRKSAVAKNILTMEQAEALSDEDALNLIFIAGFSSAEKVTDVSGRGVGMDVVKSNFHKLGGIIDVSSKVGEGTTITVIFPLTLAIVPALIVAVENFHFAIPQSNVMEIVWLHGADVYQKIEKVDEQEVYWLRGSLLPIMRLSKLLNIQRKFVDPSTKDFVEDRRADESDRRAQRGDIGDERRQGPVERRNSVHNSSYIVILKLGNEQIGLVVDLIIDTEEIVVKPLHAQLKDSGAFAGTTVMGDGKIAMILDMAGIARLGAFQSLNVDDSLTKTKKSSIDDRPSVLLFNVGGAETFAVPLGLIKRVEKMNAGQIQIANNKEYINFRGELVPLIRLEKAVPDIKSNYNEDMFVIIPKSIRPIGIVAANVLDNLEVDSGIDAVTITKECVIGSTLLDGALTLFLDVFAVIEKSEPGWAGNAIKYVGGPKKVLLIEDSAFYRAFISSYLKHAGHEIFLAQDGREGSEKVSQNQFDFIICDLEMPVMDGYQFVKWIKSKDEYKNIPVLALSGIDATVARDRAIAAGFDAFKSKLDRGGMFETLSSMCANNHKRSTAGGKRD